MSELTDSWMPGQVSLWVDKQDDPKFDSVVLVQVTDVTNGDIELRVAMPMAKAQHFYLRVPQDALLRILTNAREEPEE